MRNEPMDGTLQPRRIAPLHRNRTAVVVGGLVLLAAGALILLARPASENASLTAPAGDERGTEYGAARRASPSEIRAYFNDMFDRLDRDRSGSVEPAEVPRRQVTSVTLGDGTIRQLPLTQAEWLAQGDGDEDGRVTRTEFFGRLIPPVQAIFGVPPGWQPREDEGAVAR